MLEPAAFRANFPVFERVHYLNAGTEGPMPTRAAEAGHERIEFELREGRSGKAIFEEVIALATQVRSAYARVIGAPAEAVALTGSTTDGMNTVLAGLDLRAGDEVLTTDEEHPGLLVPLALAREKAGITIRPVPFGELGPESVGPQTRLIACSHVSWATGRTADCAALAQTGVPVLLDAAQSIGAIPVDMSSLGCSFYAASGQKWLCGPSGSGCLFVDPAALEELRIPWGQYGSVAPGTAPLQLSPNAGARRFDHGFPSALRSTLTLAALEVLEEAGLGDVQERAAALAARLADGLFAVGLHVAPRDRSTLVAWRPAGSDGDVDAEVARLAAAGYVVRSVPGAGTIRASVGAWCSEDELDELVTLSAPA